MYNEAHALARAIKESREFQDYKHWHEIVMSDPKNKQMVEDYQKKAILLQYELIDNKEPDQKKLEEIQTLEGILMANSTTKSYMEAQMRISTIYGDIQKILSDAIELPMESKPEIAE